MVALRGLRDALVTTTGPLRWLAKAIKLPFRVSSYNSSHEYLLTHSDNYIIHTSGRGPALSATTLLHAVNNVWSDAKGHAIEGDTAGKGLFEGNVFLNVQQVIVPDFKGQLNSCPDTATAEATKSYLGRLCQGNIFSGSSAFSRKDTGFLSEFKGLPIARSTQAKTAQAKVPQNAGFGKI